MKTANDGAETVCCWYANSPPPMPAMNADSPKPSIFAAATLIPAAAAARSFERTAISMRPAGARRSRATSRPIRQTTTSRKTPKMTRG